MITLAVFISLVSFAMSMLAIMIATKKPIEIKVEKKDPYEAYRNKEGLLTRKKSKEVK